MLKPEKPVNCLWVKYSVSLDHIDTIYGLSGSSAVKNLTAMQEPTGLISDFGRSPGEGNGNLLQYSCLGNPRDRGAWQAIIHGIAKNQIQLSN